LYKIHYRGAATYDDAQRVCRSEGANLASYGNMSKSGRESLFLKAHAIAANVVAGNNRITMVGGRRGAGGQWLMPDGQYPQTASYLA
jgi:hypothetical protein